MNQKAFDNFALNDNKYQIEIDNYLVSQKENTSLGDEEKTTDPHEYLPYKETHTAVIEPRISMWDYLEKSDVKQLFELKKRSQIRKFIEHRLDKKPKGIPRIIFRELIYTVSKFCRCSNFSLEQSGAVLSQFYLTHLFFTSSLDIGAEKLYEYFKELQLCHSLPFPPHSIKLFNLEEIKNIMMYFCKLYLRNLPIIRFMSLPNFTLCAKYPLEPDLVIGKKKKGKKGKKGKKKKGKGKKKKK